jgi:small subunit ribosomal protein S16
MLRIRLSRTGKKRQPSYRIVVADIEAKRDGRIVERIGNYDPRAQVNEFTIREDRALYWLSVGAQPSDAVRRLLVKQGTYERLGRLHGGESLDTLVAEFQGVELPQAVPAVEEATAVAETMADPEAAAAVAAVSEMAEAVAATEPVDTAEAMDTAEAVGTEEE